MATDFYGTVNGFKTYTTERNITRPSEDDNIIQAALIVASEWLDAIYRSSFPGLKVGQRVQVREWPRIGAQDVYGYSIASDSVPREVEYATYEAALREMTTPGSLSMDYTPPKYKQASVHGAVSVTYSTFDSVRDAQIKFQKIDEILSTILRADRDSGLVGSACRV